MFLSNSNFSSVLSPGKSVHLFIASCNFWTYPETQFLPVPSAVGAAHCMSGNWAPAVTSTPAVTDAPKRAAFQAKRCLPFMNVFHPDKERSTSVKVSS